jgi:hypothetical protein
MEPLQLPTPRAFTDEMPAPNSADHGQERSALLKSPHREDSFGNWNYWSRKLRTSVRKTGVVKAGTTSE